MFQESSRASGHCRDAALKPSGIANIFAVNRWRKRPPLRTHILALDANSDAVILDCRIFSVSLSLTKEFLMNLGSFVTSRIALLDEQVIKHS